MHVRVIGHHRRRHLGCRCGGVVVAGGVRGLRPPVAAMAAMFEAAYAADGSAERDLWCTDTWDAVAAHIGAAQRITHGAASNQLLIAVALHERFPLVAAVFAEGLITYQLVRTVVQRGALVVDPDALHELDRLLAEALSTREPMSMATLEKTVDAFVAQVDPHAVHRTETRARGPVGGRRGRGRQRHGHGVRHPVRPRRQGLRRPRGRPGPHRLPGRPPHAGSTPRRRHRRPGPRRRPPGLPLRHRRLPRRREPTLDRGGGLRDRERGHPRRTPDATSPTAARRRRRRPTFADAERRRRTRTTLERGCRTVPTTSADERTALDGEPPAMFTKPLRELTLTEALTPTPGRLASLRPAALMGGQFLPGAIACRATVGATITRDRPPRPSPTRTPLPTVEEAGRLRPLPRHDVPLPGLQGARHELRCRPHDSVAVRADRGVQPEMSMPSTSLAEDVLGRPKRLARRATRRRHRHLDRTRRPQHITTPGSRLLFPELSEPTATVVSHSRSPRRTPPD